MSNWWKNAFTRRDFIARSGKLLAAASLLPYFNGEVTEAMERKTAKVGVIKSDDRRDAVRRGFDLADIPNFSGKKVLIKPNFNTADPAPGSTHNDTLEEIIDRLWAEGAEEVIIGERSGPPDTEEVMREKGIFELAEERDVEVINFDQLNDDELIHFNRDELTWQNGFHVPRILQEVDHIIAAGCLKTHQYGGQFTMALKLAVGIIPREGTDYMGELHGSDDMRDLIAEISLAYEPDLYFIDGVEAFTAGGPGTGERAQADVTLVSSDPVAVDAAGVAVLKNLGTKDVIMNTPTFELEQIKRAVEIGLGISGPDDIDLVSDDTAGEKYIGEIRDHLT